MNNSVRARIVGRAHVQSRIYIKQKVCQEWNCRREPRSFPLTTSNLYLSVRTTECHQVEDALYLYKLQLMLFICKTNHFRPACKLRVVYAFCSVSSINNEGNVTSFNHRIPLAKQNLPAYSLIMIEYPSVAGMNHLCIKFRIYFNSLV